MPQEKKTVINWSFFNNLPLIPTNRNERGVLDILGIEYNPFKKAFLCLEHDDHTPSAKVYGDNNEHYNCYACGANGTALNIVSVALNLRMKEAAIFLNDYFPGGMEKEDILVPPEITKDQLKALGLKKNPFQSSFIKTRQGFDKYYIDTSEAVSLLIDKIAEYEGRNISYLHNIFKNFPDISKEDKDYMIDKVNNDIGWTKELKESLREYDREVAEITAEEKRGLDDFEREDLSEAERKEIYDLQR